VVLFIRLGVVLNCLGSAYGLYVLLATSNPGGIFVVATYGLAIGALLTIQKKAFVITTYIFNGIMLVIGTGAIVSTFIWGRAGMPLSATLFVALVIGFPTVVVPVVNFILLRRKYPRPAR
jgi:hypothetical protein